MFLGLSADETGAGEGGSVTNYQGPVVQINGGPGPDYFAYVFLFLCIIIVCRFYKLTVSEQTKVTLN